MRAEDSAWLEYQVRMGDMLDLEKMSQSHRESFKAVFQDGFGMGVLYRGDLSQLITEAADHYEKSLVESPKVREMIALLRKSAEVLKND